MNEPALPIDQEIPEIVATLRTHRSLILRAPTGAGKTTRVPPALLDARLGPVLVLEPRRLAARAAARRIAFERGTELGGEVGYNVRFDRQCRRDTQLLVVTPGVLLRMLHDDPYLEGFGAIVFDEFHERGLESDLALGMTRLLQQTVRPEMRLLVMSATLATEGLSAYLDACPVITSEGRSHPVEIRYEPQAPETQLATAVTGAVERLLPRTNGSFLVFLPGMGEIQQVSRRLEPCAAAHDLVVLPLHGDLPAEQQDAALLPMTRRKVVLATNVAETSVTVEGVTVVVDSGLARTLVFDPTVGLDRLQLGPISKASADQRAGRAGRTQPGVCVRLWSEIAHRARPEQTEPEIRRVDLAGATLQLLALGETDVRRFPWLELPREGQLNSALSLLETLGATEGHQLTPMGQSLARIPAHPRLGRLLLEGDARGELRRAALAAALLSERDPFLREGERRPPVAGAASLSDLVDRVEALEQYERTGRVDTEMGTLHRGAVRFLMQVRDQLVRAVRAEQRGGAAERESNEGLMRGVLAAFPDRVARRRETASERGVMVGGRGVRLAPRSAVREAELFVCVEIDAGQTESLVRQASAIQRDWLEPITSTIEIAFDADAEKVVARKRLRYRDLVLEEVPAALPPGEAVARTLAAAAAINLERVLPTESSYLTRVRCLRLWMPELGLPAFDNTELRDLLEWLCPGCRSFADLRQANWEEALRGRLTHTQRQAIEREAPERLSVPSGSHLAIRYELGRPPVLAVRIQEVFGLRETPRIAGGRVSVLLHLLGPNYRPQQVTDDLASFWANTYPQVRKELRARYPRHAWPEDPHGATAERRPRPRI